MTRIQRQLKPNPVRITERAFADNLKERAWHGYTRLFHAENMFAGGVIRTYDTLEADLKRQADARIALIDPYDPHTLWNFAAPVMAFAHYATQVSEHVLELQSETDKHLGHVVIGTQAWEDSVTGCIKRELKQVVLHQPQPTPERTVALEEILEQGFGLFANTLEMQKHAQMDRVISQTEVIYEIALRIIAANEFLKRYDEGAYLLRKRFERAVREKRDRTHDMDNRAQLDANDVLIKKPYRCPSRLKDKLSEAVRFVRMFTQSPKTRLAQMAEQLREEFLPQLFATYEVAVSAIKDARASNIKTHERMRDYRVTRMKLQRSIRSPQ